MSNDKEIRDLFAKIDVPLMADDVWKVQSSFVVKHKALERLGAALGIRWTTPTILRAERDEAVILVEGSIGTNGSAKSEWSIGEALVNANYRVTGKMAPYVYAMAEKRAKDRVILKLAGLHGVYSEDEADEFKDAPRQSAPAPKADPIDPEEHKQSADFLIEAMKRFCDSTATCDEWQDKNRPAVNNLIPAQKKHVVAEFMALRDDFEQREKDAA